MRRVFEQKDQRRHYATLKKEGLSFEVLIIPDKAIEYKKGLIKDVREALEVEQVYSDARKGELAPDLDKHFGTANVLEIAGEIIKKGSIQLTTEYKKRMQEQKKKEIMNLISTNGIDPRNNLPIPLSRIELALDQVNYNFDPFKSAEEQIEPVLEVLRPILPIKFEEKMIEGVIPQEFYY
jgi:ribosome maturation protein SDO1